MLGELTPPLPFDRNLLSKASITLSLFAISADRRIKSAIVAEVAAASVSVDEPVVGSSK